MSAAAVNVALAALALVSTIVLTLVGWLLKGNRDQIRDLAKAQRETADAVQNLAIQNATVMTTLVGASGQNGLVSEVRKVRGRQHKFANQLTALELRLSGARLTLPSEPE